ncbi:MAG: biotin--[acetyl-CoA-carboxylase] ligase [Alphaproteobacteria bacterium]
MPPAPLVPEFGLVPFDTIDSTNEEARRRATAGAAEGTVIVAAAQTRGRGRRGRHWDSPAGNLHCSILLKPAVPLGEAANLSFVAAVALAEALEPIVAAKGRVTLKWPNDVLLNERKVAGILLESQTEDGRLGFIIVGVGVNVAHFPGEVMFPATSLQAVGCAGLTVAAVRDAFLDRFRHWYGRWREAGFAAVRAEWLARAARLGETVEVRLGRDRVAGRFAGLSETGALLLDVPGEGRRDISAGDVFFAHGTADRASG